MNKKSTINITIVISCITDMVLSYVYLENVLQKKVSLKNTDYAGTVDGEHVVMNYSGGSWYIEDLDSENGTRMQRNGEDKPYRVSSREPCKVEKGDIIYRGLAPLKIR